MSQPPATDPVVAFISARCRLVLDAIEASEPRFGGIATLRDLIDVRVAAGDVAGLRTIGRGLFDMSRVLPASARASLLARLRAQAAVDQ